MFKIQLNDFPHVCKTASRDNLKWSSSTNIFGSVISHKQVEAKIDGWSENLTDSVCRPKYGRQGAPVTNVRNNCIIEKYGLYYRGLVLILQRQRKGNNEKYHK